MLTKTLTTSAAVARPDNENPKTLPERGFL